MKVNQVEIFAGTKEATRSRQSNKDWQYNVKRKRTKGREMIKKTLHECTKLGLWC